MQLREFQQATSNESREQSVVQVQDHSSNKMILTPRNKSKFVTSQLESTQQ